MVLSHAVGFSAAIGLYRSNSGAMKSLFARSGRRYIGAMAALVQPDLQESAIRERLASVAVPDGIQFKSMSFVEDHSGDPAVFIAYSVDQLDNPRKDRALELSVLRRAVIRSIWDLGFNLFPYVKFVPGA